MGDDLTTRLAGNVEAVLEYIRSRRSNAPSEIVPDSSVTVPELPTSIDLSSVIEPGENAARDLARYYDEKLAEMSAKGATGPLDPRAGFDFGAKPQVGSAEAQDVYPDPLAKVAEPSEEGEVAEVEIESAPETPELPIEAEPPRDPGSEEWIEPRESPPPESVSSAPEQKIEQKEDGASADSLNALKADLQKTIETVNEIIRVDNDSADELMSQVEPVGEVEDEDGGEEGSAVVLGRARDVEEYERYKPTLLPDEGADTFEAGMIILWSGAIVDIPTGWHLCDGDEGTPNLRDRFIVGAGDTYAVGATGGSLTHTHDDHTKADVVGKIKAHDVSGIPAHVVPTHEPNDVLTWALGVHQATDVAEALNDHDAHDHGQVGAPAGFWGGGNMIVDDAGAMNHVQNTDPGDHDLVHNGSMPHKNSPYGHTGTLTHEVAVNGVGNLTHSTENHLPPYYALAYIMKL